MKGLDQLVIAKIGNSVISTNNKKSHNLPYYVRVMKHPFSHAFFIIS